MEEKTAEQTQRMGQGLRTMFHAMVVGCVGIALLLVILLSMLFNMSNQLSGVIFWVSGASTMVMLGMVTCLILMLVSLVMQLVGLHSAGQAHRDAHTAFVLMLIRLGLNAITNLLERTAGTIPPLLTTLASGVVSAAVIFFLCRGSCQMLTAIGCGREAAMGVQARNFQFVYMAVAMADNIIQVAAPFLVAQVVQAIAVVVELVFTVIFMRFLYRAAMALAPVPAAGAAVPDGVPGLSETTAASAVP